MIEQESFRDHISTVNEKGKRVWIYPKKQTGKFYRARTILSFFLLAFLFGAPFIKMNGHPFILLNVIERKFILFGFVFGPQDFYLLVLATISVLVFIVLFTAIYGRLFCGWICPQTIFMEMVYRKIEYWIEGDASQQRTLDKAPWNGKKIFKKTTKQIIFFAVAFIIGNTFVAYILGAYNLFKIVNQSPSEHLSSFIAVVMFSLIFYFVFSKFREQACVIVCPYGRLQGVLLDPNTVVVAYDYVRGEPRGKLQTPKTTGDCIDCHLCVAVCPTGIDIRNGTQLECVNCTSCIDACDLIMDKVKLPKGLIRYASLNSIKDKSKFKVTPRIIGYSIVLIFLLTVFLILASLRTEIDSTIFRAPGKVYQEQADNKVSNLYMVKLVNNTYKDVPIQLKINNPDAELKIIGKDITLPELSVSETEFLILFSKDKIKTTLIPLSIQVFTDGKIINEIKTSFLGPNK
ncbi:MAG: cytochrome c oxidase accessory protein CcoG [Ignavibacteriae bacterium]|nr:cytochrome c oxidase accessory protein CcoG [Ignavibacteriota bacterium]